MIPVKCGSEIQQVYSVLISDKTKKFVREIVLVNLMQGISFHK